MSDNKSWYIIHTASGSEKKVSSAIFEQAKKKGLEEFFEDVVIPTEGITEIRKGKKVNAEKKFLPSYILVKMVMNDKSWHMVRAIPKVSKFLGGDGKPCPVSQAEVNRIFKQMEEGSIVSKNLNSFEVGESVKVIDGPFESFIGVVMDVDSDKNRLKVSVSIFGRPTPVDLEYAQVEKI